MNITSPKEMESSKKPHDALIAFEDKLMEEVGGQSFYHIVIIGEYPRNICDEIERLYIEEGWQKAVCRTSSENGERGVLTGLKLYR